VSVCPASDGGLPGESFASRLAAVTATAVLGGVLMLSVPGTGGWFTVTVVSCVRHAGTAAASHTRTPTTQLLEEPGVNAYAPVLAFTVPPQVSPESRDQASGAGPSASVAAGE
jgi:hypothetical protein